VAGRLAREPCLQIDTVGHSVVSTVAPQCVHTHARTVLHTYVSGRCGAVRCDPCVPRALPPPCHRPALTLQSLPQHAPNFRCARRKTRRLGPSASCALAFSRADGPSLSPRAQPCVCVCVCACVCV
jgi:hypothetical protein